jgi:hypothetical protein
LPQRKGEGEGKRGTKQRVGKEGGTQREKERQREKRGLKLSFKEL